jgi:membrane dipeptidase
MSAASTGSLLRSTLVWDNHTCLPLRADDTFLPELERHRNAGVSVVSVNVGFAGMPWTRHLEILSFMRRWLACHPESFKLIATVDDIRRCKEQAKLGVVFDIEGMCPVQDNLSLVQTFYELGVRWMLIAYNRNNAAGGGCLDEDSGLTCVGRAIIDEMERVGMVLCLSHAGARTAAEALEYSRNPPIFSHSNPYGDTRHARNISDDLIRACARRGGVVGLSGLGPLLGTSTSLADHLLRQLRYTIDLVGPLHVGLGLDYVFDETEIAEYLRTNPAAFPPDIVAAGRLAMIAPEDLHTIVERLAQDNLSDAHIHAILGGNWLRVASAVWRR